jgi:hypothetical protein
MFEIAGILLFLFIFGLGFWMLIFLFGIMVPYWITKAIMGGNKEDSASEL